MALSRVIFEYSPIGSAYPSRQASMIAYLNDFKLMMIVTVISLPFVLLLSSPKKGAAKSKEAVVMD